MRHKDEGTRGEHNAQWIEDYCLYPSGRDKGKRVVLTPAQLDVITAIYDDPSGPQQVPVNDRSLAAYLALLHVCGSEAKQQNFRPDVTADTLTIWAALSPELRRVLELDGGTVVCPALGTRYPVMALEPIPLRKMEGVGHADRPVLFLYCHAVELYLKALLLTKYSAETIRVQFRHGINKLVSEAEELGLVVTCADRDVFVVMQDTNAMIEMRYIETGSKKSLDAIGATSKRVRVTASVTSSYARVCRCGCDDISDGRS